METKEKKNIGIPDIQEAIPSVIQSMMQHFSDENLFVDFTNIRQGSPSPLGRGGGNPTRVRLFRCRYYGRILRQKIGSDGRLIETPPRRRCGSPRRCEHVVVV